MMKFRDCTRGLLAGLCLSWAGVIAAESLTLDMRDVDIKEFIQTIGKITGKTIVIDDGVRGKVDVQSPQPLTDAELYEVFLAQLSVKGYAVVEVGDNILKVIPKQAAKLEGIDVQNTVARSDKSEKLVTRIIQVSDVNVDKLVTTLRPLVDQKTGVITAYAGSNAILITDRESNVRRIVKVIREVGNVDGRAMELIKLRNASAEEVKRMLTQLLEQQGGERGGSRPLVAADARTNTLIIRADSSTITDLRSIVRELDSEISSDANTRVLTLKYASAEDVAKVLKGVSSAMLKEEENAANKSKGVRSNIHIEAHTQTNALVLSGSPHLITNLSDIVRQLDVRREQVLVEAVIVEVSDDKAEELGVQWLFWDNSGASTPAGAVNFPDSSPGIVNLLGSAIGDEQNAAEALAGSSGALLGIGRNSSSGFSFAALLNALSSDKESNVLSTPSLMTMDNQEASILVGREVPVITGSTASANNSNPFQTIERKDIGVKLTVKPQINDGNTVQLTINQEVSSLTGLTASDIITNKRVINTTVLVDDRTTIVLGGLMDEDVQESESKVPLLGDIPVLGQAFSSEGSKKVKRNLMVFIRPTILSDAGSLASLSQLKYEAVRERQLDKQQRGISLMPDEKTTVLPPLEPPVADAAVDTFQFPSDG